MCCMIQSIYIGSGFITPEAVIKHPENDFPSNIKHPENDSPCCSYAPSDKSSSFTPKAPQLTPLSQSTLSTPWGNSTSMQKQSCISKYLTTQSSSNASSKQFWKRRGKRKKEKEREEKKKQKEQESRRQRKENKERKRQSYSTENLLRQANGRKHIDERTAFKKEHNHQHRFQYVLCLGTRTTFWRELVLFR